MVTYFVNILGLSKINIIKKQEKPPSLQLLLLPGLCAE